MSPLPLPILEIKYEEAAREYWRNLPPEHFMEAVPQATQRKITNVSTFTITQITRNKQMSMRMNNTPWLFMVLILTTNAAASHCKPTGERPKEHKEAQPPKKAEKFTTPQQVFDAAKKALANEYLKGFCNNLTEDSRSDLAAVMAAATIQWKLVISGQEVPKKLQPVMKKLDALLTQNGFTDPKKMEQLAKSPLDSKDPKTLKSRLNRLSQSIKNPCAFIDEAMGVFIKISDVKRKSQGQPFALFNGKLTNVKVKGDLASGLILPTDGKSDDIHVEFRHVKGGWRIEIPRKLLPYVR